MKAARQQQVPASPEAGPAQAPGMAPAGLARVMNEGPRALAQQTLSGLLNPPVQRRPNRTGLPDGLKSGVENLSGLSLDDVRVHYNAASAAPLQAAAYTRGSEIHMAPGQEQHLAHEAWHVVQQKQGRVPSTGAIGGVPLNDDPALEHEADVMGGKALGGTAQRQALTLAAGQAGAVVQRVKKQVTGITHLVQVHDESVYEGDEVGELRDRDIVDIDENDIYLSRRGPNQEEFRDVDFDGPQHYEWFLVRTINGIAAAADTYIREDTIEDVEEDEALDVTPWLIFGTDGRSAQQIREAVDLGYRRFDTAESYGTAEALAEVLAQSGLDRSAYEVIYKFDVQAGESQEALADSLLQVAAMFEGRIDTLMIHNVDGGDASVRAAWAVMDQLKRMGVAREIGVGNVKPRNIALIEELGETSPIDAIENPLSGLLRDGPLKDAVGETGARVAYYDVIETAQEIGIATPEGLRTLFTYMNTINPRSAAILSSRSGARNQQNLDDYGAGGGDAWDAAAWAEVEQWREPEQADVLEDGEEEALNPAIQAFLDGIAADEATPTREIQDELRQTEEYRQSGRSTEPIPTLPQFEHWLTVTKGVPREILELRVPPRPGLMPRYVGDSVVQVLHALLFGISCDQIPARQLLNLVRHTPQQWAEFVGPACDEITEV